MNKKIKMRGGGLQLAYDTGKGVRIGYDRKTGLFFNIAKTITQKGMGRKKIRKEENIKNKKGDVVKDS